MIDGRFLDKRCFTKYVRYYEGHGVETVYGDCVGYYECAKRNLAEALMCALKDGYDPHNKGLAFDVRDFMWRLEKRDFPNPYPHRLCTAVCGGYLEQPSSCAEPPKDKTKWER